MSALTMGGTDGRVWASPGNPDLNTTAEMYALYQDGLSLSQVAALFGLSRQSVYGRFSGAGLILRCRGFLPFIEYRGIRYTVTTHGYYRRTDGDRGHLHRRIWEDHFGPIPDGYDVHHKDEDKSNNTIANFECLPKGDHTRHHQLGRTRVPKAVSL